LRMLVVKKLKNFFWNAEIFPQVICNAMVAAQQ